MVFTYGGFPDIGSLFGVPIVRILVLCGIEGAPPIFMSFSEGGYVFFVLFASPGQVVLLPNYIGNPISTPL